MSFLLTLLLLVPPDVSSQDQIYEWSTFRREQGLLHNYVTAIVEGPDGAIWFRGGRTGLAGTTATTGPTTRKRTACRVAS